MRIVTGAELSKLVWVNSQTGQREYPKFSDADAWDVTDSGGLIYKSPHPSMAMPDGY